jgi:hypothetical protein
VLQRNPHPYALDVPAIPATVQPGDTVDHPDLIAGFEPAEPEPEPAAKAAKTVKRAAEPADTQEA